MLFNLFVIAMSVKPSSRSAKKDFLRELIDNCVEPRPEVSFQGVTVTICPTLRNKDIVAPGFDLYPGVVGNDERVLVKLTNVANLAASHANEANIANETAIYKKLAEEPDNYPFLILKGLSDEPAGSVLPIHSRGNHVLPSLIFEYLRAKPYVNHLHETFEPSNEATEKLNEMFNCYTMQLLRVFRTLLDANIQRRNGFLLESFFVDQDHLVSYQTKTEILQCNKVLLSDFQDSQIGPSISSTSVAAALEALILSIENQALYLQDKTKKYFHPLPSLKNEIIDLLKNYIKCPSNISSEFELKCGNLTSDSKYQFETWCGILSVFKTE
jgi:hypothetical protein